MSAVFTPDWGVWLMVVALISAGVQTVAGLWPGGRGLVVAKRCAFMSFYAILGAFGVLIAAFLASDFSVDAVLRYSHAAKPMVYKIAAAWGNHEGSMILWCLVLAGIGALVARRSGVDGPMTATTLGVLAILVGAFALYTLVTSNPLQRIGDPPWSGLGFNPLLQDPALAVHPPLLYVGYVGLAAPFALACAALVNAPKDHKTWARAMRSWTLGAFAALTLGIGIGGYWAYYELGWGGWWAWDPVENASLLPWIFAAALMHSALVTERRGDLAGWTVLLGIGGFALSLFGTFLTRSGAVTSVHAFANDPQRGLVLLSMLGVMMLASLVLFGLRAHRFYQPARDMALLSREGLLVGNNLFLLVTAFVVLTGTITPLFAEALGQPVSVGPPYYNKSVLPIVALAFVLTPLATMAPWGRWFSPAARFIVFATVVLAVSLLVLFFVGFVVASAGLGIANLLNVLSPANQAEWASFVGGYGRVLGAAVVGVLALVPVIVLVLALAPLSSFVPSATWDTQKTRWLTAGVAAGLGLVTVLMLTIGAPLGAGVAVSLGVWLLIGGVIDMRAKVFAPKADAERSWSQALALLRARPALPAAAIAHMGLGVLAIGAAAEAAFTTSRTVLVAPGEVVEARGAQVRLRAVSDRDGPNYTAAMATVEVAREGRETVQLSPEWRRYWVQDQNTSEVDIRSDLGGDVYVAFGPPALQEDGAAAWTIRVLEKPLVWMIFTGITMIAVGSGLAAFGASRRGSHATS